MLGIWDLHLLALPNYISQQRMNLKCLYFTFCFLFILPLDHLYYWCRCRNIFYWWSYFSSYLFLILSSYGFFFSFLNTMLLWRCYVYITGGSYCGLNHILLSFRCVVHWSVQFCQLKLCIFGDAKMQSLWTVELFSNQYRQITVFARKPLIYLKSIACGSTLFAANNGKMPLVCN